MAHHIAAVHATEAIIIALRPGAELFVIGTGFDSGKEILSLRPELSSNSNQHCKGCERGYANLLTSTFASVHPKASAGLMFYGHSQ